MLHIPKLSTKIIIIINSIVFLIPLFFQFGFNTPHNVLLLGGIYHGAPLYSFITSMFLHANFMHIFMNLWALYAYGSRIEGKLSSLKFLIFYILCGLGGNLLVYFFGGNYPNVTIGASGAICGVLGFSFIIFWKSPWSSDKELSKMMGIDILLMAAFSLIPGVSWLAHLGGLLTGLIIGLFIVRKKIKVFQKIGLV